MGKIDIKKELDSDEYKKEWKRIIEMRLSMSYCLMFCFMNASRDGQSNKMNFFLRMIDDIVQSVVSIEILAKEGVINTCRRELRYILELALKSCLIVQKNGFSNVEDQIKKYEKLLNSSNIDPINTINFSYFNEVQKEDFLTYTKRQYGYLCKYSHLSTHQLNERLERINEGRTIGYEGIQELQDLNNDIEKTLSIVIVFLFHSVDQYVVGDFLVPSSGGQNQWYFSKSKFVNIIDQTMDYKHERKSHLEILEKERSEIEYF